MKRLVAVISGLLVLPAFAEVAPEYFYQEMMAQYAAENPEMEFVTDSATDEVADVPEQSAEAQPVVPVVPTAVSPRNTSGRAAASRAVASSTTTSARNVANRATAATTARTVSARPAVVNTKTTSSRAAVTTPSRAAASRTGTTGNATRATTASASRTTSTRPSTTASRTTTTRPTTTASGRNVVSRGTVANASRSVANRNVISRAGTPARVSLQGSAIRGSKATTNTYTYLSNRLYTGNYSNIIDSTTGLISAEAYNNCMESYYACMDEICTARNAAQRRCACAGRVKAFAEAEAALEQANEELIKVSGELALLIATKGKNVSQAFQLTDAEKVMNCVSWKEASKNGTASEDDFGDWCAEHALYDDTCSRQSPPSYCEKTGNNFGFDIDDLDGSGSDILASLQSWADAKEATLTIITDDTDSLTSAFEDLTNVVGDLAGIDGAFADSENLKDSLAETWGYELFEYAHNNVCNRVLDSCFNGIYEACGTPPSGGRKCGNGQSQCPYNYNSYISVSNTGTYELDFIEPNTGYTASNSATCFGYTSASGDPYTGTATKTFGILSRRTGNCFG